MVKRRPRDIGTAAETATVKEARFWGFPMAMRLPLSGRLDRGDVLLNPGSGDPVYLEVKAGAKAKNASDNQIVKWLDEHKAAWPGRGWLVVVRERRSAGFWWAVRYEGTRVVFQWLQDALQAESEALQEMDAARRYDQFTQDLTARPDPLRWARPWVDPSDETLELLDDGT